MNRDGAGPHDVFLAFGQYSAIEASPFAVDSFENPKESRLAKSYDILEQVAPLILQHQGTGRMTGFLLNKDHPTVTQDLGDYQLEMSLDEIFGYRADQGYGLVIAVGPNEFVGAGSGFRVSFRPKTPGGALAGVGTVNEGIYRDGKWIPGRRLNGDENDQGQRWRFASQRLSIEHCTVYRYE